MADIIDLETDFPDCPMYTTEEWGCCSVPGWGKNGDLFLEMFRCFGEAFRKATGMPGLRA